MKENALKDYRSHKNESKSSKGLKLHHLLNNDLSSSKKKLIERKTDSIQLNRSKSLKKSIEREKSPKFLPNEALKNKSKQRDNLEKINIEDVLTKQLKINHGSKEKSSRSGKKSTKEGNEQQDYYKYWKKKATEYQQKNFNLHRLNSALQEQNEILKHQNEKLEKRIEKIAISNEGQTIAKPDQDKIEKYYRVKIEQLSKKIDEKDVLILRQEKKIQELSKNIEENYKLKNLLDNLEEKVSEKGSGRVRNSSNEKYSERSGTRGTEQMRLMNVPLKLNNIEKARSSYKRYYTQRREKSVKSRD